MRIRRASVSVGLGLSLVAGVLTSVVVSAPPAQASWSPLPTLANAQPVGFDAQVLAAAGGDDTLYLGGGFTQAGRTTGPGAWAETQMTTGHQSVSAASPQFSKGSRVGAVYASVFHDNYSTDGFFGWFVGGSFTSVGGQPRTNFAALDFNNSVGAVVADWSPAFDGDVTAMAVKPAGGGQGAILYVGGPFTSITFNGQTTPRFGLAAFDIDTQTLLPWAPRLNGDPMSITVSGNRVYVGGGFTQVRPSGGSWTTRNRLAAFAADDTGTLLPWAPSVGNFNVAAVAVMDDTVYAGGDFSAVTPVGGTSTTRNRLAAFAADDTGTLLPWAPSVSGGDVSSLSITENVAFAGGRPALIVGGSFTGVTPVGGSLVSRDRIMALALGGSGALLPWAPSFNGTVFTTSVSRQFHRCPLGTNKCVYVGGDFSQAGSVVGAANQARARIAAVSLDDTGTLTSWSPGVAVPTLSGSPNVRTVTAGPVHGNADGLAFFGGEFNLAGMASRNRLAALNDQGELTSWAPSVTGGTVRALAARGDQVYVGGTFTGATDAASTSATRNRLAAFSTAAILNPAWNPNVASGNVYALAADDTLVYVGGDFINIASVGRRYLAAVSRTGGSLATWGPTVNGTSTVSSLAIAGGRLYVGGNFPSLGQGGTLTRSRVASILLDDTGTVTSWNPGLTGGSGTASISLAGSQAFISGDFTAVGGQTRTNLAAVSTDDTGSVLALNVPANSAVNGAVLGGGQLVVGGNFTTLGGQTREYAATVDDTGTGVVGAALNADNTIDMVTSADGQVILGGTIRSLGGVVIGNVAYGPRAPASVTASATRSGLPLDGELDLSWTTPWSGTFPLQGYRIEVTADGGATWTTLVANTGSTNTSRTITGLTNGTAYSFRITSLTQLGAQTSAPSTPVAPVADSGAIRGSQTQLNDPAGIARDALGRLYAANQSGADAVVTVYAPNAEGNVPPVARLTRPAGVTGNPVGLTLLPSGEVWVSYNSCFLARFAALAPSASGDVSPVWVVNASSIGSGACQGVAIDPNSGEILLVRGPNLGGALITLPANAGGVVGNSLSWTDNVSAVRTTSGISRPYLLSLDSSGNVFVTDDTTLVKIPRQANGALGSTVAPLQRVTGMYWPRQTVQRSDGSLVVTELNGAGNPTLNVFGANADGAATPIQVITGSTSASTTNLNGIALSADELTAYVTSANNAITWLSLPALQPAPNPGPGPGPGPQPQVPGAPRAVTATAGTASAMVAWQAPSNPGSYPVTSYQVVASPGGATCMTSGLTCTVKGLTNGTSYTFRVKALSGAGWGQQSAPSNAVTPYSGPGPEPAVTITITGSRDGRKITVVGASTGLSSGAQVTPWVRAGGGRVEVRGRPVAVSEDGSFDWSRRVPDVSRVWVHFTADGVKSNVLSLRR